MTIYNDPANLFAAEFMGSNNRLEGKLLEKANGHATIDVFGERLTGMARTQAVVGDAAVGIIRLERMRCAREPGPNRLPMRLEAPMYLGERWELLFERGDTTVRAYATSRCHRANIMWSFRRKRCGCFSFLSFRGASAASEPGIHNLKRCVSHGFRARRLRRPRNDGRGEA